MIKHFEEVRVKGRKSDTHCDLCGRDVEPGQEYLRTLYSDRGSVSSIRKEHLHPDECFLREEEEMQEVYEESYALAVVAVEEKVEVPVKIVNKMTTKEVVVVYANGDTGTETILVPEMSFEPLTEQPESWSGHASDGYPDEIPF